MKIILEKLPYEYNALAPYITKETVQFHYDKHHQGYVNKINAAIEKTSIGERTLEGLLQEAEPNGPIFNNAAQIKNHTLYWNSLTPNSKEKPFAQIEIAINKKFGNFENFKKTFTDKAISLFGSGWIKLVKTGDDIAIIQEKNAGTHDTHKLRTLLICDVWEHAYYIDYRHQRAEYLDAFWKLVNWDFVEKNYIS